MAGAALPLIFILLSCVSSVIADCMEPNPTEFAIMNETRSPHSRPLFTQDIMDDGLFKIEVTSFDSRRTNFTSYFSFVNNAADDTSWEVRLVKPIDLDEPLNVDRDANGGIVLNIYFECKIKSSTFIQKFNRKIYVLAVDEYPSSFPSSLVYSVREDVKLFDVLDKLNSKIIDFDYHDVVNANYKFTSWPYLKDPLADARPTFGMTENGILTVDRGLDFETKSAYYLNLTAQNRKNTKVILESVVEIDVVNVNDNSVGFVTPYCKVRCPHTEAHISIHFNGLLSQFMNIKAEDDDGDEIHYEIIGGSPKNYSKYLAINPLSGAITMNYDIVDTNFNLMFVIVKATVNSSLPMTTKVKPVDEAVTFGVINFKEREHMYSHFDTRQVSNSRGGQHFLGPFSVISSVLIIVVSQLRSM